MAVSRGNEILSSCSHDFSLQSARLSRPMRIQLQSHQSHQPGQFERPISAHDAAQTSTSSLSLRLPSLSRRCGRRFSPRRRCHSAPCRRCVLSSARKNPQTRARCEVHQMQFFRLSGRPDVSTALHHLSHHSRALISFMASAPPALARRVSPPMAAPNPPVRRLPRCPHGYQNMPISTRVKGDKLDKPLQEGWAVQIPRHPVYPLRGLPRSRHRDGSIYRGTERWKERFHFTDRRETRLKPMSLSDPARSVLRGPRTMLQIFSIKLAKIHVDGGLVELYGYIAVRDALDPLLNYVMSFSRDDPIIVEQGSLIKMAGPKRGMELVDTSIIEYDIRIKTGKQEKDDVQLIDGVTIIDDKDTADRQVFRGRISGKCGIIDITASRLNYAVEATIEVLISEVYTNFYLCLGCFTSGLCEETQLFDGVIGKPRDLKRSVVAVRMGTNLDLKFKVGSESFISAEHLCSFMANRYGYVSQEIKTGLALFSVKVTWSTMPPSYHNYD